jgi:hypothetical protein
MEGWTIFIKALEAAHQTLAILEKILPRKDCQKVYKESGKESKD